MLINIVEHANHRRGETVMSTPAPTTVATPETLAPQASGLEGVVVADTAISDPDGAAGTLTIRGHDLEALAGRVTYEDAVALVLDGALPDASGRERMREALGRARVRAFAALPSL